MKYIYGSIIGGALVYGFLFTFEGIKGDFPAEYYNKFVATKSCERCEPTKCTIEEPRVIALDSSPYLKVIKALNFSIADLKSDNEKLKAINTCYEAKCIVFAEPNCD